MCSSFAELILRADKSGDFRLLAAQTPLGEAIYRHYGLDPIQYETNILLQDGFAYFKSEGSIRIFSQLGFPWSLLVVGRLLPLFLRDRIYGLIARNRLRWFGTRQACFVPDPSQADRFI